MNTEHFLSGLKKFEDAENRRKRMEFIKKDFQEKMKELKDPDAFKLPSEILNTKNQEHIKRD